MNIYLHIGTEKTGTTTLQNFLYLNKDKLLESGYYYPKSAGLRNHQRLSIAAYNLEKRDPYTRLNNINSDRVLESYQNIIVKRLKSELNCVQQPNIIFSSEHIQSRLTSLSEIQRLKEILVSLGAINIIVIVYLRNPVEIANSLYSTAIKCGSEAIHPFRPSHEYIRHICDHKSTIENYTEVFGKGAVVPRIFESSTLEGGSLLKDFINVVGLTWDPNYIIPNSLNESLSVNGLEILRRFNTKVPRFINERENPLRRNIVEYFELHFAGSTLNKYVMPQWLIDEYEDNFIESNECVRKTWFPERKALFQKYTSPTNFAQNIPDAELDNLSNMLANIWIDNYPSLKHFSHFVNKASLLSGPFSRFARWAYIRYF